MAYDLIMPSYFRDLAQFAYHVFGGSFLTNRSPTGAHRSENELVEPPTATTDRHSNNTSRGEQNLEA